MDFIDAIENALGRKAQKNYMPLQAGDVPSTWADVEDLWGKLAFRPNTSIELGVAQFVAWYKQYYGVEWLLYPTLSKPLEYPNHLLR